MKAIRCILKLVAVVAAVAGIVCLVKTYWDTLEDIFYMVVGKIKEKKAQCCDYTIPTEFDDFADSDPVV